MFSKIIKIGFSHLVVIGSHIPDFDVMTFMYLFLVVCFFYSHIFLREKTHTNPGLLKNVLLDENEEEKADDELVEGARSGMVRPSHRTLVLPLVSCFLASISATAFLYSFHEDTFVLSCQK